MKSIDDDTRSYQLLAASAYDRVTAGPGDKSFTAALIQALKLCAEECQERPFSLWKLHDTINHQTHRRSNPCYIHDRLKQHNRHIYLAPLKKDEEQRKKTKEELELRTSDADLVLRFALGTRSLTAKQIDALTRHLSKACKEAEKEAKVNTHRIDWVHYEERRPNFRGTANALMAARKLRLIAGRRQTISSAPDLDIPDSLTETMEGDSPAPLSSSNRPIPTSANAENVHIDRSDKTTINTTGDARINAQLSLADGPQALPDKEIREICAVQTPPTQITGVQIVGIVAGSWVLSSLTTYLLVRTLLERK
ncbi:homeobox domain containing protein [Neofusicoccum parvum]|nr:homeobox domain containing protein [Neofusicoccum parvum]